MSSSIHTINPANHISSQSDSIDIGLNGLNVSGAINGLDLIPNPKIKLKFSWFFSIDLIPREELVVAVNHNFKNVYMCGAGVSFTGFFGGLWGGNTVINVTNGNDNYFQGNTIFLTRDLTNHTVFLHEIIHAILHKKDPNGASHNPYSHQCSFLDIFAEQPGGGILPGMQLDLVNRLEMQFTQDQLVQTHIGEFFLDNDLYPSLSEICSSSETTKKSQKSKKVDELEFLELKLGDEYDHYSGIKEMAKMKMNRGEFITRNIEKYKNKLKSRQRN